MQAIDTNLLVRLFVNDDAVQAAKARALFDRHADEDGSLVPRFAESSEIAP